MSIAEQMGAVLQNTAASVNIKERLDFSCALFDGDGGLVANAPHMPVHIGSMDASIKALIKSGIQMNPGDSFVHNNPYDGGTHLPDINVITPVFDKSVTIYCSLWRAAAIMLTLAVSHLALCHRLRPTFLEEGVTIDFTKLVSGGTFQQETIHNILTGAKYPARNPHQNIGRSQSATGCQRQRRSGIRETVFKEWFKYSASLYGYCQDNGEESVRRAISNLKDTTFEYELDQHLDDGGAKYVCLSKSTLDGPQRYYRTLQGRAPKGWTISMPPLS